VTRFGVLKWEIKRNYRAEILILEKGNRLHKEWFNPLATEFFFNISTPCM
jgi:hypothetical protein